MCLVLFAWDAHPEYELVLAANRDEFHSRPSAPAGFWDGQPSILAGRDLQAGGTWMGVTRSGRFAAITNYREPAAPEPPRAQSRGFLVRDYLASGQAPLSSAQQLARRGERYSGFNLLLGSPGELAYVSNRGARPTQVETGLHGLSNHLLDTDWPKVHAGRERLEEILAEQHLDREALFALLTNRDAVGGALPGENSMQLTPENLARHYFIQSPVYGTRCATILTVSRNGRMAFEERRFDADGAQTGVSAFEFDRVQAPKEEFS